MAATPPLHSEGLRRSLSRVGSRVGLRLKETFSPPPRSHSRPRSEINPKIAALRQTFTQISFDQPLASITPGLGGTGYEFVSRANSPEGLLESSVRPPATEGSEPTTTPRIEAPRRPPNRSHSPAFFLNVLPTDPPPEVQPPQASAGRSEVYIMTPTIPQSQDSALPPPIQIQAEGVPSADTAPEPQQALGPTLSLPEQANFTTNPVTTIMAPEPRRWRFETSTPNSIYHLVRNSSNMGGMNPPIEALPGMDRELVLGGPVLAPPTVSVDPPQSSTPLHFPSITFTEDQESGLLAPTMHPEAHCSVSSLLSSLYHRSPSPSASCQHSTVASSTGEAPVADISFDAVHARTISQTTLGSTTSYHHLKSTITPSASNENLRPPSRASIRNIKETAWSVLETGLRTLEKCSTTFPPLGLVAAGLVTCVDAIQESERHQKEYNDLAENLAQMVKRLTKHHEELKSKSLTISNCALSLALSLQQKIDHVKEKQSRPRANRIAEAMEDRDDLVQCYRDIQALFGQLECDAALSAWSITNEQLANTRLTSLNPAKQAWFDSSFSGIRRRACTPNTRQQILNDLHKWANNPISPKIYWLNGMAGTGKTTIAYSFCSELERDHRLGASFFCCRTVPECRDVARIVPTIAYQLARFSLPLQSALCKTLGSYPDMGARSLSLQFENLVRGPLLEVEHTLPRVLVIVIDALDECAGHDGAQPVLDALLRYATDLPVKFFVTGRPEPGVCNNLGLQESHAHSVLHLHDIEESLVQTDIETYLAEELKDVPESAHKVKILASRAKNLFIYAATIARYIKPAGLSVDPHERLNAILGMHFDSSTRRHDEIDELYTTILAGALANSRLEPEEVQTTRTLLYTVIRAREPMNAEMLAGFLGLPGGKRKVELALKPLRSVLHIPDTTGPISTLHISFPEYLLSRERSGEFFCDKTIHCKLMVRRCFETMTELLRFNICDLESSCRLDEGVVDLQERVDTSIPQHLFYACRYWGDHLRHVQPSEEIIQLLSQFLSQQLLFWMEVLNLRGCVGAGGRILLQAYIWLEDCPATNEIRNLVLDARKFAVTFGASPVSRSTPHIYISMLPFWSTTDPMWETYGKRMKGLTEPQGTAMERRDGSHVAVWTLGSRVTSIAVSSSGAHIASGSDDFLLRIWDMRSGKLVLDPLGGHAGGVVSVAFSPDDAWIASGSNDHTVRIWDARTGRTLAGPLVCGTSCVTSVAFSPCGDFIVSGSLDNTICVWDARTGGLAAGPFKIHTDSVKSVAFSPKGFLVASGSDDHTVRVCDLRSRNLVAVPFGSHSKPVNSVAFSPDGAAIASGSDDCVIHIWDVYRDNAGPRMTFRGHTDLITSVAFSPDGAYVVSGSYDRTVRVWSLETKAVAFGPFKGHTDTVRSVAFTPDGTCVVSGAYDKSIRIWDLKSKPTTATLLDGHTDHVCSVAFSPDGQHIVSSSHDSTIRMWDTQSGSAVLRPFKQISNTMARSVTFSPSGSRLALGLTDGSARIWDQQDGRDVVEPFRRHRGWVTSVAFSPDGHHIASSLATGDVFVWSVGNGRVLLGPLRHPSSSPIRSVSFSPDGKWLVSSAKNGTICVWDTRKGTRAVQMTHEQDRPVRSVAFSPDSSHVVSGSDNHTIRIWDAKTGRTDVGPLQGHAGPISSVSYSFNGALVASGSHDRTICVWDAKNGTLVTELQGHMDRIESVAFSPNDMRIVSGSFDRVIRVWDVSQGTTNVPSIAKDWSVNDDGWVIGRDGGLLLWVPSDLRTGLMRPQNPVVIYRRGSLKLKFNDALIGERWRLCYMI
ncbi:hypothetical protein FRC12_008913 [Ceratobasidium sp. 428]|nr:hypothetical protein FRC12_008913 [Ceratobasidium sp. 428]